MSYSVDVNILLYASDRTSSKYNQANQFLQDRASDPELFYVAWPVVMSYLRIATHPRIFAHPLAPDEALNNIEALFNLPQVRLLSESERFLQTYRAVSAQFPVRGNLVPDAHLATLLHQNEIKKLYSSDTDFKKFDFLDVRDPFM